MVDHSCSPSFALVDREFSRVTVVGHLDPMFVFSFDVDDVVWTTCSQIAPLGHSRIMRPCSTLMTRACSRRVPTGPVTQLLNLSPSIPRLLEVNVNVAMVTTGMSLESPCTLVVVLQLPTMGTPTLTNMRRGWCRWHTLIVLRLPYVRRSAHLPCRTDLNSWQPSLPLLVTRTISPLPLIETMGHRLLASRVVVPFGIQGRTN